jgi:hypothetical protein
MRTNALCNTNLDGHPFSLAVANDYSVPDSNGNCHADGNGDGNDHGQLNAQTDAHSAVSA